MNMAAPKEPIGGVTDDDSPKLIREANLEDLYAIVDIAWRELCKWGAPWSAQQVSDDGRHDAQCITRHYADLVKLACDRDLDAFRAWLGRPYTEWGNMDVRALQDLWGMFPELEERYTEGA